MKIMSRHSRNKSNKEKGLGEHLLPAAKDVVESWPVPGFEESDDESKGQHLFISLCTCETEREHSPANLEERDPDLRR